MNLTRLGLLPPIFLLMAQSAPDPLVIGFPQDVVEAHRLTGSAEVELPGDHKGLARQAGLLLTIDPAGKVTEVRVDEDGDRFGDPAPAIAAARQWTFRPFEYRGRVVHASVRMQVKYRPAPAWADPQAAFPAIDYDTLRIELRRGACFGSCPVYKVTIAGDGTVTYSNQVGEGEGAGAVHQMYMPNGVLVGGKRRTRIDRAALDGLVEKFRAAHFFGLKPEYRGAVTDLPTYVLRFSSGGKTMEVTDYAGDMDGMPEAVSALEQEVDRVAGTARWVEGDETTVPALLADGLDLRSPQAAALAQAVDLRAGDLVVRDLIAAGLPLDQRVKRPNDVAGHPLGVLLLADALRSGAPRIALMLIERGWLAKMPARERASLFADSAGGCDPAVARAMIAAGVDPNARSPRERDMGIGNGGGTALHAVRAFYSSCDKLADRAGLVKALIALGVDPNLPDSGGETPIYGIEDPDLLATFLASGARVDVKDRKGNSPVFGTWNDLIVLMLLEAGADPKGRYYDGKSLAAQAKERDMPAAAAWLKAHGIR